ncbi:peroxidase-like [Bradysia coprophila]|uniref:peroxidase-like n=1 Tax=Bradysia coprophila TaxID=38358 RepID=UPI00187D7177|nr:peroxidase-like [Bradysia coprophila]
MGISKCTAFLVFSFVLISSFEDSNQMNSKIGCPELSRIMRKAKSLVESETNYSELLEQIGFLKRPFLFSADSCNTDLNTKVKNAKVNTIAAQIYRSDYNVSLQEFETSAINCTKAKTRKISAHQKYRSIDGRGNNLKNPEWGASDTPFSRYGPPNYEDGIYKIKKSVTGADLPNARLLVQDLLMKAVRSPPPKVTYNMMALLIILFATHDLHYQVPTTTHCKDADIRCCSKDGQYALPNELSNSACFPIEISKEDPFYKHENIGCLNVVRSQLGTYSNDAKPGQILNRATAYLDLSLIYGNHASELRPIRLYEGGKLRMGKGNLLPVDSKGKYLPSMDRFVVTPIGSIWPALFARNHNNLAERLAKLNKHWDNETVFQEARRINIANFQFNLITAKNIEKVFNKVVNESYSEERNAATCAEFSFTYRAGHYYIPQHMVLRHENDSETKYLQSDTIGKIDILENDFDAVLSGATQQHLNVEQYADEVVNRIGKNPRGYGMDLIALDIQRGRDQGISSFVEIRRKCNLKPEINSFDDFGKIVNKTNVDLLKRMYESFEDVDFYVGGLLESFASIGNPLAGPTFGCVIGENYNNVMGGDIYFFTHPDNPYPFTTAQINAVRKYRVSNIFCTNSNLNETYKYWSLTPGAINPKIKCDDYPPMDLSAWKD